MSRLGKRRRNMLSESPKSSAPSATLNLQSDFAWVHVLALLCWPKNQRDRHRVEATYGADLLGWAETLMPQLSDLGLTDAAPGVAAASAALGVAPNRLEFMPGTQAHFARMTGNPREMARDVVSQVFKPAGSFKAVADAPGSSQIVEQFSKASQGGGRMAGWLLVWIAVLAAKEPKLGSSLNRAIAILENQQKRFPAAGIPSSRTLKVMWKEWRGIAPLWAALIIQSGSPRLPPNENVIEALFNPERLKETMGWALWLREFATTFTPLHSDTPIIPASEAVELVFDIKPLRPPFDLADCEESDLKAAYGAEYGGDYRSNPLAVQP